MSWKNKLLGKPQVGNKYVINISEFEKDKHNWDKSVVERIYRDINKKYVLGFNKYNESRYELDGYWSIDEPFLKRFFIRVSH
jgi:hypothetical protein